MITGLFVYVCLLGFCGFVVILRTFGLMMHQEPHVICGSVLVDMLASYRFRPVCLGSFDVGNGNLSELFDWLWFDLGPLVGMLDVVQCF